MFAKIKSLYTLNTNNFYICIGYRYYFYKKEIKGEKMTTQEFDSLREVYEQARDLQEGIEILDHILKSMNDKDQDVWVEILSKDKVTDKIRPLVDTYRHLLDTDAIYEIIKEELDTKIESMLPGIIEDMITAKKAEFEELKVKL